MKYLFLIYADESLRAQMTPEQMSAMLPKFMAYGRELEERGVLRANERLQPVKTATSVQVREGKTLRTDGPFAETKEQLAGFYLVDCANLDEALELAAKIPTAAFGTIEVRPVMEFGPPPAAGPG